MILVARSNFCCNSITNNNQIAESNPSEEQQMVQQVNK